MNKKLLYAVISAVLAVLLSLSSAAAFAVEEAPENNIPVVSDKIDEVIKDIAESTGETNPSQQGNPVSNLCGDINNDGIVDVDDVTDYQLIIAGQQAPTDALRRNGNTLLDQKYNISDSTVIQYYLTGVFKMIPVTVDGYYATIIQP